jgi:hypothetical protein
VRGGGRERARARALYILSCDLSVYVSSSLSLSPLLQRGVTLCTLAQSLLNVSMKQESTEGQSSGGDKSTEEEEEEEEEEELEVEVSDESDDEAQIHKSTLCSEVVQ